MPRTVLDPAAAAVNLRIACQKAWGSHATRGTLPALDLMAAHGADADAIAQVRCDATGLVTDVRLAPAAADLGPETVAGAIEAALAGALAQLHPAARDVLAQAAPAATSLVQQALAATVLQRQAVREHLGVAKDQILVVAAASRLAWWNSEFESLYAALYACLPADAVALAAVACAAPGREQLAATLEDRLVRNGLRLIAPGADWRSAVLAADCVIGEAGPLTTWAALLGIPVLVTGSEEHASLVAGEHRSIMADRVEPVRLDSVQSQVERLVAERRAQGAEQLEAALAGHTGVVPEVPEAGLRTEQAAQPELSGLPQPVPGLIDRYRPMVAWTAQLHRDDATVTWDRYPAVGRPRRGDMVTDIAADRRDRFEATVQIDHQRTCDPAGVDAAAAELIRDWRAKAASIRVADNEIHVVTAAGAKYRLRTSDPIALDVAPLIIATAGGLAPHLRFGQDTDVELTCLRPPAYIGAVPAPLTALHSAPWPRPIDDTVLTAALAALDTAPTSTGTGNERTAALAGRLFVTALRHSAADPTGAVPVAGERWPAWNHERIARIEAELAGAHQRTEVGPTEPVTTTGVVGAAVNRLVTEVRYLLALRSRPWNTKDDVHPIGINRRYGEAVYTYARDAEAIVETALVHLQADTHEHQLASTEGLPEIPVGSFVDEAAARTLLAARLDDCPVCQQAWRERISTDPATSARAIDLAAWAHGDIAAMARGIICRLDPKSSFSLPPLGYLLATGGDLYAAMCNWAPVMQAHAVAAALHQVGLRRLRDRHDDPHPPRTRLLPVEPPARQTPDTAALTDGDDRVIVALAVLGLTPGRRSGAAAALADAAANILTDLVDGADAADRPTLLRAMTEATQPLATDPDLSAHLLHRLADRCMLHLTLDVPERDGLAFTSRKGQSYEAHARAASGAARTGAVLLRALADPASAAYTSQIAEGARWAFTLGAADVADAFREHSDTRREHHSHAINLIDPVPGIESLRRPLPDNPGLTVNHGYAGEQLFAAAVDDCAACCESLLLKEGATSPEAAAVMIYRTAESLGTGRVRALAREVGLDVAGEAVLTGPVELAATLNTDHPTVRRTLMRQCAEALRGAYRLTVDV